MRERELFHAYLFSPIKQRKNSHIYEKVWLTMHHHRQVVKRYFN